MSSSLELLWDSSIRERWLRHLVSWTEQLTTRFLDFPLGGNYCWTIWTISYKCSCHPSLKKHLCTANGSHHRKPQLEPRTNNCICSRAPAFMEQMHPWIVSVLSRTPKESADGYMDTHLA